MSVVHQINDGAPYLELIANDSPPSITLLFANREPIVIYDRGNLSRLAIDLCEASNFLDRRLAREIIQRSNNSGQSKS